MPDDRIEEWALGLVKGDVQAFKRARSRFLRQPSAKRLHDVRTTARRLRCVHEDLHDAIPPFSLRRLRHVIDLTGEARDAAVLREALREALDVRERRAARHLLRVLRRRERVALKRIARALEDLRPPHP
ncbi:MAG TPA: CHAD domain-containing protein [Candidatus Acidoferrales bacterium]|nr:CHAD domain-containing protein [Candidatus Acidoferrales bacterium]